MFKYRKRLHPCPFLCAAALCAIAAAVPTASAVFTDAPAADQFEKSAAKLVLTLEESPDGAQVVTDSHYLLTPDTTATATLVPVEALYSNDSGAASIGSDPIGAVFAATTALPSASFIAPIPEPATIGFGLALASVCATARRRGRP